jgi:hypothetical protein
MMLFMYLWGDKSSSNNDSFTAKALQWKGSRYRRAGCSVISGTMDKLNSAVLRIHHQRIAGVAFDKHWLQHDCIAKKRSQAFLWPDKVLIRYNRVLSNTKFEQVDHYLVIGSFISVFGSYEKRAFGYVDRIQPFTLVGLHDLATEFSAGAFARVHIKVPQVIKKRRLINLRDLDARGLVHARGHIEEDGSRATDRAGSVNVRGSFRGLGQTTVGQGVAELTFHHVVGGNGVAVSSGIIASRRFLRRVEQGDELVSLRFLHPSKSNQCAPFVQCGMVVVAGKQTKKQQNV